MLLLGGDGSVLCGTVFGLEPLRRSLGPVPADLPGGVRARNTTAGSHTSRSAPVKNSSVILVYGFVAPAPRSTIRLAQ